MRSLAHPEDGWVFITEILNFPRLKGLNADQLDIFEALKDSFVVEVSSDFVFIRKRARGVNNELEVLGFSKQGL